MVTHYVYLFITHAFIKSAIFSMRLPMLWLLFHPYAVGYVPHYGRFLMFGLTGLTGLSGRFPNVDYTSRSVST